MTYTYYLLTSDREELTIESEEALFIDELAEKAKRNDIMIINMEIS